MNIWNNKTPLSFEFLLALLFLSKITAYGSVSDLNEKSTLFPGAVPSESVATNVVTVDPTATSSSNVIGCGIIVKTGGISLRS